jgi:glutamine synthetase
VNGHDVDTTGVEPVRCIYCDLTDVQRSKMTGIADLDSRLSSGINVRPQQNWRSLGSTRSSPSTGLEPVGGLRLMPDPETFAVLPWLPSDAEREQRGSRPMPKNLRSALSAFAEDSLFRSVMPNLMWRAYQETKQAECGGSEHARPDDARQHRRRW